MPVPPVLIAAAGLACLIVGVGHAAGGRTGGAVASVAVGVFCVAFAWTVRDG